MVSRTIQIHYFLKDCQEKENCLQAAAYLVKNGVSHLWLELKNSQDFELVREISSHSAIPVVSFIRNTDIFHKAAKNSDGGVAIVPSMVSLLLSHAEAIKRQGFPVYLVIEGNEYLHANLNQLDAAVGALKERGIYNLFINVHHHNPVVHFKLCKLIKNQYGTKQIISFTPHTTKSESIISNSLSLGSIFYEKIGDAVLVSLPPDRTYNSRNIREAIDLSKNILGSCRLYPKGFTIISCPTCGRCRLDLLRMTEEIDHKLRALEQKYAQQGKKLEDTGGIAVAVMGCNVNGPGEARNADIGIAGGRGGTGTIFMNGKPIVTLPEKALLKEFTLQVEELIQDRLHKAS